MNGNFKVRCIDVVKNTCYTQGKTYEFRDGKLTTDNGEGLPYNNTKVEKFKDWQNWSSAKWELVEDHADEYIKIHRKKNKVIATLTSENGTYIKHGKATCSPTDVFDFEIGSKLALARLFVPSIKDLEKPSVEPFRKAKVGDKIKIVKDGGSLSIQVKPVQVGDIKVIGKVLSQGVYSADSNYFSDDCEEYIIIEKAEDKPEPTEIKPGDTVEIVDNGQTYSTYEQYIKKYARDFSGKYSPGYAPKNSDKGIIVARGEHMSGGGNCYAVLANDRVFCIGEKGIRKVE